MAKIFPIQQQFVDLKTPDQIVVTRARLVSSSDYMIFPGAVTSAKVLDDTVTATVNTGVSANAISIENGEAGQEVVIIAKVLGMINYGTEEFQTEPGEEPPN